MRKFLGGLLLVWSCAAATAAEVRTAGTFNDGWGDLKKLTLTGKISAGDAKRVSRLLGEDDSTVVFLNSTGGDYREGLALAALFKERLVRTFVPAGSSCLSACAIAFLGGSAEGEEGTQPSARSIAVGARLGFHAPFIETGGGDLTLRAVEEAYDHAIGTVTDFIRVSGGYGVSAEVAADMMTPQRSDLFYVRTVRDLRRVGAQIHSIGKATTLTPSMAKNLCLNGWVSDELSGTTWTEAEETMAALWKDLAWREGTTVNIESGMFGDVMKAKRAVLPMTQDGEGAGYYSCLIEFATVDGELVATNRGYIYTVDTGEILADAKAFNRDVNEVANPDINPSFMIMAIDPLDRNAGDDELRFGIVPESTPIEEIESTIHHYTTTEKAL